jgi:5'-deoxynucleotidase YfbR-like HD superfamily hydrolase
VRSDTFIATITNKRIYPFSLDKSEIDIEDIAHALARICRFNGHLRYHYSVAEHSVNVAEELKLRGASKELRLFGLLHDASEAYIADIPRPLKDWIPEYLEIEKDLQRKIIEKVVFDVMGVYKLSKEEMNLLNHVDSLLAKYEAQEYMGKYSWNESEEKLLIRLTHPMSHNVAQRAFLGEYSYLTNSLRRSFSE